MGNWLSRNKKTTTEILENLEKDIASLENFRKDTELREKRVIGKLLIGLIASYVASIIVGYFYFFPKDAKEIAASICLLVFVPVFIWTLKLGIRWYFRMRLETNQDHLADLRARRKKILEDVKETETYKVATEILEKFDPDTKLQKAAKERKEQEDKEREMMRRFSPFSGVSRATPQQVRRRLTVGGSVHPTPGGPGSALGGSHQNLSMYRTPVGQESQTGPQRTVEPTPGWIPGPGPTPGGLGAGSQQPIAPRLSRPVLPRERGFWDKMVDYVIGDGPNNRYALICHQCCSHNGMAMREDFEYLAFRCAYCLTFNPAKKQRPNAPHIPTSSSSVVPSGNSQASQVANGRTADLNSLSVNQQLDNRERARSSSESELVDTEVTESSPILSEEREGHSGDTLPELDESEDEAFPEETQLVADTDGAITDDVDTALTPLIVREDSVEEKKDESAGSTETPSGNWEVVD